jgi:hypothetical protein
VRSSGGAVGVDVGVDGGVEAGVGVDVELSCPIADSKPRTIWVMRHGQREDEVLYISTYTIPIHSTVIYYSYITNILLLYY